ncbi:hypothetical protein J2753_002694 [Halolamina salifodinae]|uniref:Uncharacterized protein n=1 Tax=Halolamina salifodinae TaxID=1202767 RepID=A0A8T4H0U8_9EURY|nr:hypothetical protein [Halolamina salifodinae]
MRLTRRSVFAASSAVSADGDRSVVAAHRQHGRGDDG